MRFISVLTTALIISGCSHLNPVTDILERELPQPEHSSDFVHETALMRTSDAIDLHTEIFLPVDSSPATPCMIVRIPLPEGIRYELFRSAFGSVWARRGYTTIIQNVRGFPPSGGTFEPFSFERADGLALLAWLDTQRLCRGPKTTWGGSYFGLTQWAIGDQVSGPKMIQIASPRLSQVFFPGGAFALETALYWSARNRGLTPSPQEIREATSAAAVTDADNYLLGENDPAFESWFSSGANEETWLTRFPSAAQTMTGPVFLMGGWFDPFLPAMLADMQELTSRGEQVTLTIGPWAHAVTVPSADGHQARNYRIESIARPIGWLRCHAEPGCIQAPVEIFIMGSNRWLQSTSYPPPETTVQTWVVDLENRSLSTENGTSVRRDSGSRHHSLTLNPHDPTPSTGGIALGDDVGPLSQSELVARPEVMHVASQALERDVTIIGEAKLTGTISQGTCAPDLAVTMVDIFPDGSRYLVTEGIRRITSGMETTEVSLWPTAYTFKQGHRIELVLAPAKYPKYALPPCASTSQGASPSLTLLETARTQWKLRAGTLPPEDSAQPPLTTPDRPRRTCRTIHANHDMRHRGPAFP